MPSGPKRRRAAKRKQEKEQAKQTDELTTVSVIKLDIPIEELAKGAVWHEAASVDEELDKAKNTIGEVAEVNEVSLLDNVVVNDEPLVESSDNLKGNESCGVVCNDSKEVDLLAVAPEQNFEQPYDHELLSDVLTLDEMFERDVPVGVPDEATEVDVLVANEAATGVKAVEESNRRIAEGFGEFNAVSVVESAGEETMEDNKVSSGGSSVPQSACYIVESTSKSHDVLSVCASDEKKDIAPSDSVTVMPNDIVKEAENSMKSSELFSVVLPEEKKDTNVVASGVSTVSVEIVMTSVFCDLSTEVPEEMKDTTTGGSGASNVVKETDSTSILHDQSTVAVGGMKNDAKLVSDKDTGFILPGVGLPVVLACPLLNSNVHENVPTAEVTGCSSAAVTFVSEEMQAVPTSPVSSAAEKQVNEIPAESQEIQAVPTATVSPATQNQVFFACPLHCSPDCCFAKWPIHQPEVESMMSSAVELKGAIHSLKEDLLKALEKLDAISY